MTDIRFDLHLGDCLGVMRDLEADSVDSVVTDPPAGIGFMGKAWDGSRGGRDAWVAWLSERMAEALRVAKPGAHALVWALPRMSHWTALALEDAGWLIEDRIAHHFGQGFPKHRSKLKPATEDWWLCTKPGGAKWLNVDGCRVGWDAASLARDTARRQSPRTDITGGSFGSASGGQVAGGYVGSTESPSGRWPSNVVLTHHPDCEPCGSKRVRTGIHVGRNRDADEDSGSYSGKLMKDTRDIGYADPDGLETVAAWRCVEGCPVAEMDRQSGERTSGKAGPDGHKRNQPPGDGIYGNGKGLFNEPGPAGRLYGDTGGASRFFPTFAWEADDFAAFLYCAKASRSDRGVGNTHPTVKPLALMRWLVRLVTPSDGTVLDPFAGSGTTGLAALKEGFRFVGAENDPDSHAYAHGRLAMAAGIPRQPTLFEA